MRDQDPYYCNTVNYTLFFSVWLWSVRKFSYFRNIRRNDQKVLVNSLKYTDLGYRFLILVDLSTEVSGLLSLARDWSVKVGAEIVIVHKVTAPVPALTHPQSKQEIVKAEIDQAMARLRELTEATFGADFPVKYRVSDKSLVMTLPEVISEGHIDIIFAGLKPTGVFKSLFIGSTITEVVDYISNIVVSVPPSSGTSIPKKINVAINPAYPLKHDEFKKVLMLFGQQLERIYFFTVLGRNEDKPGMDAYLKELSATYEQEYLVSVEIFNDAGSFARVRNELESREGEILVLQRGSRTVWDILFRKSRINDFIYEGSIPFITLP